MCLPECWNSPYSNAAFPKYAEVVPGIGQTPTPDENPSSHALCEEAKKLGIWLIGGSVPERVVEADGKEELFNTCIIINPSGRCRTAPLLDHLIQVPHHLRRLQFNLTGEIVGKHRKVHLFDIDVPGKIRFKESETLSPGQASEVIFCYTSPTRLVSCYVVSFIL